MSSVVVACQTIRDEVNKAIAETGVDYPVIWVQSGLHSNPSALQARLSEEIAKITNARQIILTFGYCGNAVLGLSSPYARLILPKVDDCISLLLGSYQMRLNFSREMATYYLTKGWLDYENNLWQEYQRCVSRYGSERALLLLKKMLLHYRRLLLIDTGAYCLDECLQKTRMLASVLELKHQVVPGSLQLLKKLLTGPWGDEFFIIPPGQVILPEVLGQMGNPASINGDLMTSGQSRP